MRLIDLFENYSGVTKADSRIQTSDGLSLGNHAEVARNLVSKCAARVGVAETGHQADDPESGQGTWQRPVENPLGYRANFVTVPLVTKTSNPVGDKG